MMNYHEPVLATESIAMLAVKKDGIYVDATFGGGGHSRLILGQLGEKGRLFAFDQDEDALEHLIQDERFVFNHHNFRFIRQFMRLHGIQQVDGILADLGVSSHQLDVAERGFSFRFEADLDMRMNQSLEHSAADIVNRRSAAELQEIFSEYGEVRNARSLALRIAEERALKPIQTIGDFLRAIEPLVRGGRSRYLAQVFQALRIEVNDEMGALEALLESSLELLKPGGRLVVIAYHSIEDRLVKNFLKTGSASGEMSRDFYGNIERPFELVSKGVITPTPAEIERNPRARSAKMRVGERSAD
jgi:16S rRNA (cytosine1402-N4)-methyltransferase